MTKPIILGLCTANRCRSQMFEALMRHESKEKYTVLSAGTKITFVHPLSIKVLDEIGVSVQGQTSKHISDLSKETFSLTDENKNTKTYAMNNLATIITLCGSAKESCPAFPGPIKPIHWPIDDPDQYTGTEEEILPHFRASRDDIHQRIKQHLHTS